MALSIIDFYVPPCHKFLPLKFCNEWMDKMKATSVLLRSSNIGVGRSRFTVVSTGNTEFILVLLFIY